MYYIVQSGNEHYMQIETGDADSIPRRRTRANLDISAIDWSNSKLFYMEPDSTSLHDRIKYMGMRYHIIVSSDLPITQKSHPELFI